MIVYIYIPRHAHMSLCKGVCTNMSIHIRIHIFIYVCVYVDIHIYFSTYGLAYYNSISSVPFPLRVQCVCVRSIEEWRAACLMLT